MKKLNSTQCQHISGGDIFVNYGWYISDAGLSDQCISAYESAMYCARHGMLAFPDAIVHPGTIGMCNEAELSTFKNNLTQSLASK